MQIYIHTGLGDINEAVQPIYNDLINVLDWT